MLHRNVARLNLMEEQVMDRNEWRCLTAPHVYKDALRSKEEEVSYYRELQQWGKNVSKVAGT